MNQRTLRLIVFGFGGLVLILGLLTIFTRQSSTKSISITTVGTLPTLFTVSAPGTNNTIITSNGRAFVSYNYTNGQAAVLSPDTINSGLDGVDSILTSDDAHYIVFHQTLAGFGTTLKGILQNAGLDSDKGYWWVYDTQSKVFTPIKQSISNTNASVSGDSVSIIDADPNTSNPKLTTYELNNPSSASSSIAVTSSDGFFHTKNGYILTRFNEGNGSDILFTKDGVVSKKLFTNADAVAYISSTDTLFYTLADGKGNTLYAYDMGTAEQTEVASDTGGSFVQHGNVLLFTLNSNLATYDTTTKKLQQLKITDKKYADTAFTPTQALADDVTILQEGDSIYLAGNGTKVPQAVSSYDESVTVGTNQVEISYNEDEDAFLITLDATNTEAEKEAVYQKLRDDGLNPYLLDIRFTVFTAPNVTL